VPLNSHWWMSLPAIPSRLEDRDYRRLRKIWGDKTRFRGRDKDRKHEFVTASYETHLMTTLWENFSLFEARSWLQQLANVSGIAIDHSASKNCDWSYGFRENSTRKIADIVIGFDGVGDKKGCYVIEAKRPGGKLGPKDLDPGYYLNIEKIRAETELRRLIYCVDLKEKERVRSLFSAYPEIYGECGVITWEEVGGIQIALSQKLEVPEKIRTFIAGAIQYQYCQHDLIPAQLAADYLSEEPSIDDVFVGLNNTYDNHDPQWAALDRRSGRSGSE